MNKYLNKYLICTILAGLAACSGGEAPIPLFPKSIGTNADRPVLQPDPINEPMLGDDGVIVAETRMDLNVAGENTANTPDDCGDYGTVGVTVENAQGDVHFLYDKEGNPCEPAQVLFDGTNPTDRRPPPPRIHIAVQDDLGPLPTSMETAPQRLTMNDRVDSAFTDELLANESLTTSKDVPEYASTPGFNLAEKAAEWQQQEYRQRILQESQKALADLRDLDRLSTTEVIEVHQDKITDLMAKLRQAEAEAEKARQKNRDLQDKLSIKDAQDREMFEGAKQAEAQYRGELSELQRRLLALEKMNQRLASQKNDAVRLYEERIARLSGDLKAMEEQAGAVRKELVLEAAAKIAEAERIASAARFAETQAMEREAARKRQESEMLLQRAQALNAGKAIMIPEIGNLVEEGGTVTNLNDIPVVVHVTERTLPQILDQILNDVKGKVGQWDVVWRLDPRNQYILQETWSVNAETRLSEVLKYLQTRVAAEHSVELAFQQFEQGKKLVISDQKL